MSSQDWSRVVRKTRRKGKSDATAISIIDVINHYGGEVKEGRGASVRCVMHDDSRKSAVMNTYDNLYYCHTCGKGGSAVDVIMDKEGLGFKDALERAIEISKGSGVSLRSGNKRRGAGVPRRTWDI